MAEPIGSMNSMEDSSSARAATSSIDDQMDAALRISEKIIEVQDKADLASGPIGLDVGTCNIVMAQNRGNRISISKQQNAFFAIPQSKFTRQILQKNDIVFFEHNKLFYIVGDSAENFANMFNANTMRPMEKGLLTFKEDEGVAIIQAIIKTLVQRPKRLGEIVCFSVPGEPVNDGQSVSTVSGHETVIKMYLESLGYLALSINEALAIVMAEMGEENFTGIGISMGGGMCNVCLAYMSVPVLTFSIQKGGDAIDESVSKEVGLPATKVKGIKEAGINLSALPKNKVELALQMYYTDLINTIVKTIEKVVASSNRIPKISDPLPVVISGGTASPKGFKERFEVALRGIRLPFEIASIRIARDPLYTTAKGALVMAMSESK
jgi:actin-like ATPase involved in cell morphogenesis